MFMENTFNLVNRTQFPHTMGDIKEYFTLPIGTIERKVEIPTNIVDDLELVSLDASNNTGGLYSYLHKPTTEYGVVVSSQWKEFHTSDLEYLRETKKMISGYDTTDVSYMLDCWSIIKGNPSFREKYRYIEWSKYGYLNNYEYILQLISIYSLCSPLISLCMPIIFLLFPFILLKIRGIQVSLTKYVELLYFVFRNHSVGKLLTNFHNVSWNQRIYLIMSVIFYFLQIYQNVTSCVQFHYNLGEIHQHIHNIRTYLQKTTTSMEAHMNHIGDLKTYSAFTSTLRKHHQTLYEYKTKLDDIEEYKWCTREFLYLGYTKKWFYQLYENKDIHDAFMYSFGFLGYLDNLNGIKENIREKRIVQSKFSKKKQTHFNGAYYPPLLKSRTEIVKNTYDLSKNVIITGPNASGKTTILKTTLFNILCCQQIGFGFFKSAILNPYDHIHCYLNIPDTSGRDSLFQAEARRCKDILQSCMNVNKRERHFCIFDELYSGTNPYEAVASAYSFLRYLVKNKRITFMLTTHFTDLCEFLHDCPSIQNMRMEIQQKDDSPTYEFDYKYKLEQGISLIKGGVKVLVDLEYPPELVDDAQHILCEYSKESKNNGK